MSKESCSISKVCYTMNEMNKTTMIILYKSEALPPPLLLSFVRSSFLFSLSVFLFFSLSFSLYYFIFSTLPFSNFLFLSHLFSGFLFYPIILSISSLLCSSLFALKATISSSMKLFVYLSHSQPVISVTFFQLLPITL